MRNGALLILVTGFVAGASTLAACVGSEPDIATNSDASSNGDGTIAGDGATSGDSAIPATGFTISASPAHVTGDPGDAPTINVAIVRAITFTDPVDVTVTPPNGMSASAPQEISNTGTSTSFTLTFQGDAVAGDSTVTIKGSNPSGSFVEYVTPSLGVHVGSLLDTSDSGLLVPSGVTSIIVDAWGAGGGSAQFDSGIATGGGGGYAHATVAVTPGSFLTVRPGTGGSGSQAECEFGGTGAGGGGYSAVCPASGSCLIIAGAGGGGSGVFYSGGFPQLGAGGAGGGASGQGSGGYCNADGGTQTNGGAPVRTCSWTGGSGSALKGGDAQSVSLSTAGGAPGGGAGTDSCGGGGGGGFFGGGAGGFSGGTQPGGGAGGSGFVPAGGTLAAGNLASPGVPGGGGVDPRCPANTAQGGNHGGAGGPGCIIVTLPKP